MAKGVKVTEAAYRLARALLSSGENPGYIMETTGLSRETLRLIRNSKDYQDYFASREAYNARYPKKQEPPAAPEAPVKPKEPATPNGMLEALIGIHSTLDKIAIALGVDVKEK